MSTPSRPPRSTVNVPAAVGVAVVFLAGVIVWVVASQMSQDEVTSPTAPPTTAVTTAPPTVPDVTTTTTTTSVVSEPTARPGETTPIPLPSNTPKQDGSRGLTTAPKATAAPPKNTPAPSEGKPKGDGSGSNGDGSGSNGDGSGSNGDGSGSNGDGSGSSGGASDLGISGYPIQQPTCDGAFVTVMASVVGTDGAAERVKSVLDRYPDANYLRTDKSCRSFAQSSGGQPIFVVFLGPFAQPTDACDARGKGAGDAYVKRLSNDPDAGGAKCE